MSLFGAASGQTTGSLPPGSDLTAQGEPAGASDFEAEGCFLPRELDSRLLQKLVRHILLQSSRQLTSSNLKIVNRDRKRNSYPRGQCIEGHSRLGRVKAAQYGLSTRVTTSRADP